MMDPGLRLAGMTKQSIERIVAIPSGESQTTVVLGGLGDGGRLGHRQAHDKGCALMDFRINF